MSSLVEEFPKQQERVRELLVGYLEIGPNGSFGAHMIGQVLTRAERAAASQDVVSMLSSFEEMKGCE